MRRDGFYHSALVLQKPNRTLLNNNNKFTISTIYPQILSNNCTAHPIIFSSVKLWDINLFFYWPEA